MFMKGWFRGAYERMDARFGDLRWWPAETAFEMAVGSILTQNTAWKNVERAVAGLKRAELLDPHRLLTADSKTISEIIRPCGYYNIKTKRLLAFVKFLHDRYSGSMEVMFREGTDVLRRELLSVKGIGEETADSILLYGDDRPVFVVDAYTRRILERHGVIEKDRRYGDISRLFMESGEIDPSQYNQYHALLVNTAKHYCRSKPKCGGCPLSGLEGDVSRETSD